MLEAGRGRGNITEKFLRDIRVKQDCPVVVVATTTR